MLVISIIKPSSAELFNPCFLPHHRSDFNGSDAAGLWQVPGPLPAGAVLLHHRAHAALREGQVGPRQEFHHGLPGHFLPAAEQRCIPHVRAAIFSFFFSLLKDDGRSRLGVLQCVNHIVRAAEVLYLSASREIQVSSSNVSKHDQELLVILYNKKINSWFRTEFQLAPPSINKKKSAMNTQSAQ